MLRMDKPTTYRNDAKLTYQMFKEIERKYVPHCTVIRGEPSFKQHRLMVTAMNLRMKSKGEKNGKKENWQAAGHCLEDMKG